MFTEGLASPRNWFPGRKAQRETCDFSFWADVWKRPLEDMGSPVKSSSMCGSLSAVLIHWGSRGSTATTNTMWYRTHVLWGVRWVSMENRRPCLGLGQGASDTGRTVQPSLPSILRRCCQEPAPLPLLRHKCTLLWGLPLTLLEPCLSTAGWNLESHLPLSFYMWEASLQASVLGHAVALKKNSKVPWKPVPGFLRSGVCTWIIWYWGPEFWLISLNHSLA